MIKFTRFSAQIAAAALIMATAGTNVYAAEPAVAASSTAAVTATATAQETTAAERPSKAGSTTATQAETKSSKEAQSSKGTQPSKEATQAETKSGQQKQNATAGAAEATETVKQYEAAPKDGLVRASNGTWYYYRNNQVDWSYCGMAYANNRWWYVKNGTIDFKYTGMAYGNGRWWYFENGSINFKYTGMAYGNNRWWMFQNGSINFKYSGTAYYKQWWVFQNGSVNFKYTGMAYANNNWWMFQNGSINFKYSGLGSNKSGQWLFRNGRVAYGYTGSYKSGNTTYNVVRGQVKSKSSSVPVSSIAITSNTSNVSVKVGSSISTSYSITPSNATNKGVTWRSSNSNVASVDGNGKVTGRSVGTATISVTSNDGGKTASYSVHVYNDVAVTGVTITSNKSNVIVRAGTTVGTSCSVAPSNATNKGVTWSSSNSGVATVDGNGTVKGVSAGTANITVKTNDGGKTDSYTVYVYQENVELPGNSKHFLIKPKVNTGLATDYDNGDRKNGTNVGAYGIHKGYNQLWRFDDYRGKYGGYAIVTYGGDFVLDVYRPTNGNMNIDYGDNIDIYAFDDPDAQIWNATKLWDGSYVFRLNGTNGAMTISGSSSGAGINFQEWNIHNESQRWYLEEISTLPSLETTAQKVARYAKAEVGYKENPTTCWTKYTQWYLGRSDVPSGYEAWCAMFVSYIQNEAGDHTVHKFCSCGDGLNQYKSQGKYRGLGYIPKQGDIVFFTSDGSSAAHVGIVGDIGQGNIYTIEGNFLLDGEYQVAERWYNSTTGVGNSYLKVLGYGITD